MCHGGADRGGLRPGAICRSSPVHQHERSDIDETSRAKSAFFTWCTENDVVLGPSDWRLLDKRISFLEFASKEQAALSMLSHRYQPPSLTGEDN